MSVREMGAELDARLAQGRAVPTRAAKPRTRSGLPMLAPLALVSVAALACWGLGRLPLSLPAAPADKPPPSASAPAAFVAPTIAQAAPAAAPIEPAAQPAFADAAIPASYVATAPAGRHQAHLRRHAVLAAADVSDDAVATAASPVETTTSAAPAAPAPPAPAAP